MKNDDAMAMGIMVVVFAFILLMVLVVLAIQIFFLLTLFRCMKKVSPENRTMEPGLVWLNLVPILSLGWIFYTVIQIKESLLKEFSARNLTGDVEGTYKMGLTYAILAACSVIPYIGILPGLVALVFWIIYWVQLSKLSKQIDEPDYEYDVQAV